MLNSWQVCLSTFCQGRVTPFSGRDPAHERDQAGLLPQLIEGLAQQVNIGGTAKTDSQKPGAPDPLKQHQPEV
jgi:hypothetical protein